MFNDTDTVGYAFKRAFYRVDGVTMYVFLTIWAVIAAFSVFDEQASDVFVELIFGSISPILYVVLGLTRLPGLVNALIIAAFNVRFLSVLV
ncbi:hypothetical protein HNR03_000157 [Pseudomonas sp. JAI111]|uniref:hypothetical protein n=1 Tax=Pseudomonas sp. JAI111 TaxID=2735913 RepID=UPI002168DC0A|nr:hypothetical protein [Pseudomonas sp. JAI111]MCS3835577.1 hypothetical protein [Pseudomonas sp. JAI111]